MTNAGVLKLSVSLTNQYFLQVSYGQHAALRFICSFHLCPPPCYGTTPPAGGAPPTLGKSGLMYDKHDLHQRSINVSDVIQHRVKESNFRGFCSCFRWKILPDVTPLTSQQELVTVAASVSWKLKLHRHTHTHTRKTSGSLRVLKAVRATVSCSRWKY